MAIENYRAPALPLPPAEYSQRHLHQLINALRLYFNQLDANNANKAYSYRASKIILDENNTVTESAGALSWNTVDQTANLGLEYGVTNQIGQEYYARVANNTGMLIPNGTVVGFAGATANALLVAPYLADGASPSLYVLGIMTHDLPDSGDKGYCTVWGFIRNLDTSAFNVGDVLYASPTVAGGLTNVKPTAPNNVIPIAACVTSDPSEGVIFVRPTIEQMEYYGEFSKTDSQSPASVDTAYAVALTTTGLSNGVTLGGSPTTRLIVPASGLYRVDATVQITSTSASAKNIWIWLRKNGTDIPNSARVVTITGNNAYSPLTLIETVSLTANQYVELVFASSDTAVSLSSIAATAFAPASPAVKLAVVQEQQ